MTSRHIIEFLCAGFVQLPASVLNMYQTGNWTSFIITDVFFSFSTPQSDFIILRSYTFYKATIKDALATFAEGRKKS